MTWLRIDDGFAEHPRVQAVSERARWLHVTALCYSSRNLNDGLLDAKAVKVVCAIVDKPCRRAVGELVTAGLWLDRGAGAFQIKDYLEWNPDAETVKRLRKQRQEAGSIGGRHKQANAKADATAFDQADAIAVGCTPSHPIPSHESSKAFGLIDQQEGIKRLVLATGARTKSDMDKITRTVVANKCSPGAIKLALTACTGPGVNDPLAVALSTLKKRRAA